MHLYEDLQDYRDFHYEPTSEDGESWPDYSDWPDEDELIDDEDYDYWDF